MTRRHPTTVLQIVPRLDAGGAERTTIEIAEAIVKAGGRALVLSEGGRQVERLKDAGAECRRFPAASKNPARVLWNAVPLARLIVRKGVHLVHARSRAPAWSALLAARLTGCSFVTTYHGAYSESGRLKNLYNGVMARSAITIANSRHTAELIRSRYGKPENEIAVIPRGVDARLFDPDRVDPKRVAALRRHWHVGPDDRVVLHAARLSRLKGQQVVVEAARRLREQGRLDRTAIVLAGDAPQRSDYPRALEERIRTAGLERHVRLVGGVDDMPAAFLAADVALLVSTEPEGFGRVAAEAQAMRRPLIVTRIGGLPETLLAAPAVSETDITGWIVAPGDAAELADALAAALSLSAESRAAMGQRGRTHVLRSFSVAEMQGRTLTVYDRLLGTDLAGQFRQATRQRD